METAAETDIVVDNQSGERASDRCMRCDVAWLYKIRMGRVVVLYLCSVLL